MITFIMDAFLVQLGEVQLREATEATDKIPRMPLAEVSSIWDRVGALYSPLFIYRFEAHVLQVRNFPQNTQYPYTDN